MILSILIIGCSGNYESNTQPTQPPNPAIGGGCGVSEANTEGHIIIKKIPIQGAF